MIGEAYEYAGLIIGGIVVILIIRMIIGIWASKKVESNVDYVLAGRRLPLWMAAPSIMATWFAAETLMGSANEAYQYGFQGVVFDPFGATLCLIIAGVFVVRLARRAQYVTIMDFFQHRYGTTMSVVGTVTQIITYFGWTAAQIVAGGAILQALLGLAAFLGHDHGDYGGNTLHPDGRPVGRYRAGFHADVPDFHRPGDDYSRHRDRGWRIWQHD